MQEEARRRGLRVVCAPHGSGLQTGLRAIEDGRIGEPLTALAVMQAPGPESWRPRGIWGIIDPHPITCECGTEQLPLFTASSGEFDGGAMSWQPIEEAGTRCRHSDSVEVTIGRGYTLQLYYCPGSEHHVSRLETF